MYDKNWKYSLNSRSIDRSGVQIGSIYHRRLRKINHSCRDLIHVEKRGPIIPKLNYLAALPLNQFVTAIANCCSVGKINLPTVSAGYIEQINFTTEIVQA